MAEKKKKRKKYKKRKKKKITGKVCIFPFAEGIPYLANEENVIIPYMTATNWHNLFQDRDTVVCVNCTSFAENVFALTFFEYFYKVYGGKHKLEWLGNLEYKRLIELQGLAKYTDRINLTDIVKYPVPAFFNKNKTAAFINPLNNYKHIYTYHGKYLQTNDQSIFGAMWKNIMQPWSLNYLPKFRLLEMPEKLDRQAKLMRFDFRKPFILILPDTTGWSDHKRDYLGWTPNDIKAFSAMTQKDYNMVIATPRPYKYNGINALITNTSMDNMIWLIKRSRYILSSDIDYSLVALLIGGIPISHWVRWCFSFTPNKRFLGIKKPIHMCNEITPISVFNWMHEFGEYNGKSYINDGNI